MDLREREETGTGYSPSSQPPGQPDCTPPRGSRRGLGPLLAGAALLSVGIMGQSVIPSHQANALERAVWDAGHLPLFTLASAILLWLRARTRRPRALRWPDLVLLLVWTGLLGVGSELAQRFVERDASVADLLRDVTGSGIAACLALAFVRRTPLPRTGRPLWRVMAVVAAVGLAAWAFFPLGRVLHAYQQRSTELPILADFEGAWVEELVSTRDCAFSRVAAPWPRPAGTRVGRLALGSSDYPAWIYGEVASDWRGYEALELEIFLEGDTPLKVILRIDDARHNGSYVDRFRREISLQPGAQHLRIPLADIAAAPQSRTLDIGNIRSLTLFADRPGRPSTLYIDDLQLTSATGADGS